LHGKNDFAEIFKNNIKIIFKNNIYLKIIMHEKNNKCMK